MPRPQEQGIHSSKAFYYHHAIMVGMHNWGIKKYWQEVFNTIGVQYTTQLVNHLDRVTKVKQKNKERKQSQDVKQKRAFKQDAIEKQLLMENRTKEYSSGMGLDIGFENSNSNPKPLNKKPCKCGSLTHIKIGTKTCPLYNEKLIAIR